MAPPKKGKKKQEEDLENENEPDAEVIESQLQIMDPYRSLRYSPAAVEPTPKPKVKTRKVPVMKKRNSSQMAKGSKSLPVMPPIARHPQQPPTTVSIPQSKRSSTVITNNDIMSMMSQKFDKLVPNFMTLDPRAGMPIPLSTWVSPGELPLTKPPPVKLRRRPPSGRGVKQIRRENFRKEAHSLAHFEQIKREQLEMENFLMKKLGKPRSHLLLRRSQVMPHVEPDGLEEPIVRQESCDAAPPDKLPVLSFFNYGRQNKERKGLTTTMTRSLRGHNVITEWFGSPHVTDAILKQLGVLRTSDESVKLLEVAQQRALPPKSVKKDEFVPLFPGLAVVGMSYKDANESNKLKPKISTPRLGGDLHHHHHHHHHSPHRHGTKQGSALTPADSTTGEPALPEALLTPKPAPVSGVMLSFGGNLLSWYPADNAARSKLNYTVEIGCVAELGQSAVSSTTMSNLGSVAISYNWVKERRENTFELESHRHMRFAFDCWGGVILPGETHRVPCLYKANAPGYFSEDWRLVTRPTLECGAPVTLRLWGITRKQDTSRRDRDAIEKNLRALITRSLASHRVGKIIDNLPLKEVPLRDTRFPLVHLGPDLFHLKNPSLKYHSASVYRLGKMLELFDTQLFSRQKPPSPTKLTFSPPVGSLQVPSTTSGGDWRTEAGTPVADVQDEQASVFLRRESSATSSDDRGRGFSEMYQLALDEEEEDFTYSSDTHSTAASVAEEEDEFSLQKMTGTYVENVAYLAKMFLKRTNIDSLQMMAKKSAPIQKYPKGRLSKQNLSKSPSEEDAVSTMMAPKTYVNVVDPSYQVDTLRARILSNSRLEIQEAAFEVMDAEVSKLSFRPFVAKENWKVTMGHTYLCQAIDSFAEYAIRLKKTCCHGQFQEQQARKRANEAAAQAEAVRLMGSNLDASEGKESDDASMADVRQSVRQPPLEETRNANNAAGEEDVTTNKKDDTLRTEGSMSSLIPTEMAEIVRKHSIKRLSKDLNDELTGDNFMYACMRLNPREVFTHTRYQDQYYARLHTRMYELLGDFVDTMDRVWASKTELNMDQDELGFTRIRDIGPGADIRDYLEAPLPPRWIQVAQKMDSIAAANKARLQTSLELRTASNIKLPPASDSLKGGSNARLQA